MKGNILVTGASGFIGSALVDQAIRRGYRTIAAIRPESSRENLQENALLSEIHFDSQESMDRSLLECSNKYGPFDYVIHAAGISRAINKMDYYRVNYEYTKNLVEALQRNKLLKQKFVFVSSLASYGPGKLNEPIRSKQPQQPISVYAKSKLKTEQFLESTTNFPFVIINPTAVYGPRDKAFLPIVRLANNHLSFRLGPRTQRLSFVHVEDLCNAIFLAMESTLMNQRFLVSDLQAYDANRFNKILGTCMQKRTICVALPGILIKSALKIDEWLSNVFQRPPLMSGDRLQEIQADNWTTDCSEILQLGYIPRFTLDQGLRETIYWYKERRLV